MDYYDLLRLIEGRKIPLALRTLEERAGSRTTQSYLAKKDLAVLLSMLLLFGREYNAKNLEDSLHLWKEIASNDEFWGAFSKHYAATDDFETSDEIIKDFRASLKRPLSELYSKIYRRHGIVDILNKFREHFDLNSEEMERDIFGPIYEQISDSLNILSDLTSDAGMAFDAEKKRLLWSAVEKGRESFDRLNDLGFASDGKTLKIKDKFAGAVHSLAVGVFNKSSDRSICPQLLGIAEGISGTEAMRHSISQDKDRITRILADHDQIMEKMMAFAKTMAFEDGNRFLIKEIGERFSGMELPNALEFYGQYFIVLYAEYLYQKAVGNDIGTNYPFAFGLFKQLSEFTAQKSGLLRMDDGYLKKAKEAVEKAKASNLRMREAIDEVYTFSEELCSSTRKSNIHARLRARFASVFMKAILYEKAALKKNAGAEKKSEDPSRYFNMATIFFLQKKYQRAVDNFSRAIQADPGNAQAYLSRARAYEQTGLSEWSRDDMENAVRLDPALASQLKKEQALEASLAEHLE